MPKENLPTDQTKNSKYAFVQREGDDFTCIKLLQGKYKGIIYKYNNVKLSQTENADGELPLKFTYDIMANPNNEDIKSTDFRNYIGDILVEVMEEQLKNGKIIFDK